MASDNQLNVEELLKYLEKTIEERRQDLERLCQETNSLFRPWPKPSSSNNDQEKPIENIGCIEDNFTPEEKDGMNLVNNILKRAKKTIAVQNRIKQKFDCQDVAVNGDTSGVDKFVESDNDNKIEISSESNCVDERLQTLNVKSLESTSTTSENKQQFVSGDVPSKVILTSKSFVIRNLRTLNSSKQSRSATSLKACSNSSANGPASLPNSSTTKPFRFLKPRSDSTACSVTNSRECDSSTHVRRSANNKQRAIPVHMSAPFKTDPNIRIPKRPSSSAAIIKSEKTVKSKYRNTHKTVSNHPKDTGEGSRRTALKSSDVKIPTVQNNIHSEAKSNCQVNVMSVNHSATETNKKYSSASTVQIFTPAKCEVQDSVDSMSAYSSNVQSDIKPTSKCDIENLPNEVKKLHIDTANHTEENHSLPFCLATDGMSLEIPVKYKRIINQNRKLRQNVSKVAVTKKVGMNERERFLQNVEMMFDQTNELGVQYRKLKCLNAHRKLLNLLQGLQLNTVNELSTPYDVLHAKMMVEFILTAYHEYEEETRLILQSTDAKPRNFHYRPIQITHDSSLLADWLPSTFVTEKYEHPPQLSYRSRHDLEKYQTAYFKLQVLQLEKMVLNTVKTELLPELQSMDPLSSNYIPMFRGVGSLLTCNGKHLPAVVKETSQV